MMACMGRPRTRNKDLPPRLRLHHGAYWYVAGNPQTWTRLGTDLAGAKLEWARLEGRAVPDDAATFSAAATRYRRDCLPKRAPATQRDYGAILARLERVFGKLAVGSIRPQHVRQYLDKRAESPVSANREVAVLSLVLAQARQWGMTDAPNPCTGVRRHVERARTVLVSPESFEAVYVHADPLLRDALDLVYLTGQRPADVLAMKRGDIRDGLLHVRQSKTDAALRIRVVGELAAVIARCLARPARISSLYLLATDDGARMTSSTLRSRFDKARALSGETWQIRDLRARAATETTDAGTSADAQALLGHRSVTTTERYIRGRAGQIVSPVRGSKSQ
jgi:integrase